MSGPRLTARAFERAYAERSGITVAELRGLGRRVAPCDCGEEGCEGWQSISSEALYRLADENTAALGSAVPGADE